MRVGLVIRGFEELGGGTERYLHALAAHLLARGAEVHVFAASCRTPLPVSWHPVRLPPGPSLLRLAAFARAAPRELAACPGLDVVCGVEKVPGLHVFMAMKGTHGGYLAARRGSAGPLWRLYSHLRPRHLLSARLERRLLGDPGLCKVRVMSRRGAQEMARFCGLPPERCAVIPHGVEAGRFDLARRPSCRAEVRGRHGLRDDDLVAVSVGSNFTLKGLAHLLRALARCAQGGGPRMRLLVVGRGREAPFRRLAERLGVAGQVVFVGASDRVPDYLLAADLFVLPSIYETFGLSVLEAMAAGLPVVVSAACGASELVEEGASGFVLAEPADSDTFAARLLALADPELRRRLGARARQTAELWPPERDYEATRALLEEAARLRRHL